ncbi:hypothetical protein [uncultured Chitinophaga sp.]|jgi:hypothetical protein|uniref:hypothetical protein n=1 Tax=uncultured Chitinophaga sp. TaxID=339340 RepID=UPI00261C930B|nr:hypothetical protein [uncultured Chitinophaga sp.]
MKRFLHRILFLLLTLFTLTAHAQTLGQYEAKIDVEIWDGVDNHSGRCTNKYDIYFLFAGSTTENQVAYQDLNPIGTTSRYFTHTYSFAANRTLQTMRIWGTREWRNAIRCRGNNERRDYTIPASYKNCYYEYTNGKIPQWGNWVRVNIYPKSILITRVGGVTELPSDSRITLAATYGFPASVYNWEYSTNGTTWTSFPAAFQTGDRSSFSANDLFGANADNILGRNVFIRIRYSGCYGADRYSDIVTLSTRLTSPRITSAPGKTVTCAGDNDGSVKIYFDRALKINEQLSIFLTKPSEPGWTDGMYSITSLAADNSVTWPSVLSPGTYEISLQGKYPDAGTATIANTSAHRRSFTVNAPLPVRFSEAGRRQISCFGGNDGAVSINASGGTGDYTLWYSSNNDPVPRSLTFNSATATLSGLREGTYTITMRDGNNCYEKNANGTEKQLVVTLGQPAAALSIDIANTFEPTAFGYTNGYITAVINGGTTLPDGSYHITWRRSDGSLVTPLNGPTGSGYSSRAENLGADTYTLTVTDANHAGATSGSATCMATATVVLNQPPLLEVNTSITDSILCNGDSNGTISASARGGKPFTTGAGYTYEWYQVSGGTPTAIGQTSATAGNLAAGTYQVKITDANSIEKWSDPVVLIDPGQLQIHFTETPATCYGGSNGAVSALVTGGTPAFAYSWSTGSQSAAISNLPSDAYTLTVTDYHGCRVTDIALVRQPSAALEIATPTIIYPRAFGYTDGSIRLLLRGGTPLAGGAYNITWRRADGTVLTSHSSQVVSSGYEHLLSNLGAGDYTITVTDANYTGPDPNMQSCIAIATFTLTEPPALTVNISEKHYVSCKNDADGILYATAAGGVPISGALPYQFEWYKKDGAVFNAIGQTTDTARGLTTGTYKVIITDWNNISKESDTFLLAEPDLLTVQLQTRAVSCNSGNDGFVKSTVSGGTLPYSWSWSNGDTTPDILDQPAGNYSLLLMDAHGCIQQPSAIITEPADPLAITAVTTADPLAYGYTDGSVTVTLKGGTPAPDGSYSVQWLDANNQVLTQHTESITANGYVTKLENAGNGSYTLQVKDAQFALSTNNSTNGCYVTARYTLTEPPLLKVNITEHRYVSCNGDSDGQLAAHAKGGIPLSGGLPYRYQWFSVNNGTLTSIPQTDSIITGMPAGSYLVRVTDFNNITRSSDTFRLQEPGKLLVDFNTTAVSCASGQDGKATAIVSGGTAPFHYEWTSGDTTSSISNITEGTYLVFVKDAHACETQNQTDIYIPGGIVIDADIKAPTCNGYCDGYIKTGISGGVPPYRYSWSNGQSGTELNNLCAGRYTITIIDANNCTRIQTFNLPDPAPLQVQLGPDRTLCNGQVWTANAAIADPQAKYAWGGSPAFQGTAAQAALSKTGTYWVSVTDSKGCLGSDTIRISQNNVDISAEFVAATQVFRNENVLLINISKPVPEKIEWVIPTNRNITVLQNTPLLAELRFADTGVYTIQLRTGVGDCEKSYSKQITVLQQEAFAQPGGAQEPFIRAFEILPNPNTGQFNAHIVLDKTSEIRLRLFNIISNQLVNDRKESPSAQFNVGYQLNVTAGAYLLLLETPMGHAIRKIIITQ